MECVSCNTMAAVSRREDLSSHESSASSGSQRKYFTVSSKPKLRWLFLAVMVFLLQVLPYLSYRWVTDESWYAAPAYSLAHGEGLKDPAIGPNDIENHFDARPPGTAIVIATAFRIFGAGQVAARLGSVFAGIVVIFLTYRLSKDILSVQGTLVATFLVATDNLLVLTSRTARPEALTTMCIFAGLLAMRQYWYCSSRRFAFLSGLTMAVGTMFHITLLGYILSIGLLAIYIDHIKSVFLLRGAFLYLSGFLLGLVPFAFLIYKSPLGMEGFRAEYLNRAIQTPLLTKFMQEGHRYADFLGVGMLHGHYLTGLPVRLPIPVFLLVAMAVLWKYRRSWFYLQLLLLIPSVLWLIYTVNKSSRYLALLAPLLALIVGAAIACTEHKRLLHKVLLGTAVLVIVSQAAANLFLLHAARTANYTRIGAELRSVIPSGQTVYGTITFWLAFRDYSFISYERTSPEAAVKQYHAGYFITGDRMMIVGDDAYYADLNLKLQSLESQSVLVGDFPDEYYGHLRVYRLLK